jgi:hypothetical protein
MLHLCHCHIFRTDHHRVRPVNALVESSYAVCPLIRRRLGKEEALRRLKNGLGEVGTSFGHLFSVREHIWTGDHLRFQTSTLGQSASGSIDIAEDVRLEVFCLGFWQSS